LVDAQSADLFGGLVGAAATTATSPLGWTPNVEQSCPAQLTSLFAQRPSLHEDVTSHGTLAHVRSSTMGSMSGLLWMKLSWRRATMHPRYPLSALQVSGSTPIPASTRTAARSEPFGVMTRVPISPSWQCCVTAVGNSCAALVRVSTAAGSLPTTITTFVSSRQDPPWNWMSSVTSVGSMHASVPIENAHATPMKISAAAPHRRSSTDKR
jgi:hypothetical protein